MPPKYESTQAALDGTEMVHMDDNDAQNEVDAAAKEGQNELNAARGHAHQQNELPNPAQIDMLISHATALETKTANLAADLRNLEGRYITEVVPLQNAIATLTQKRRRDIKVACALFGVLGTTVVAGGSVLGCYLGGLFDKAKDKPTVLDPKTVPDADSMDTSDNMDVVTETTLQEWVKLPNEMLWKAISGDAFATGKEWSIKTWAFVTAYLDKLMAMMATSGRVPGYSANIVTDSQVNADYDTWKDTHDLESKWVFDYSERYDKSSQDGIAPIVSRALRINYLARMFAKAQDTLDDDGV